MASGGLAQEGGEPESQGHGPQKKGSGWGWAVRGKRQGSEKRGRGPASRAEQWPPGWQTVGSGPHPLAASCMCEAWLGCSRLAHTHAAWACFGAPDAEVTSCKEIAKPKIDPGPWDTGPGQTLGVLQQLATDSATQTGSSTDLESSAHIQ